MFGLKDIHIDFLTAHPVPVALALLGLLALSFVLYFRTNPPLRRYQRIILGGGVMGRAELFPMVRSKVRDLLNRYISSALLYENIEHFIVPPALGKMSGVLGAIAMAKDLEKNIHG